MSARASASLRAVSRALRSSATALAFAGALVAAGAASADDASQEHDPWEGFNRSIFAFNEWLDRNLLVPVAKGWDFVAPEPVQTGIDNVFRNSGMSVVLLNDLLQLKPVHAAEDVARVVVNTTVGVAGIFDVATKVGIPENDEDFGQTLGYWGVPKGPYLVLPIFGPSNPRDTFGLLVDRASEPWTYFVKIYVTVPVGVFEFVNLRAIYLEEIEDFHETALDYYVFQRNAYVQSRDRGVADEVEPAEETEEDLYYFDDEEDVED
ncbi:MAG: VacJ family lipoprotein [Myxococcota bacterium]